MVLTHVQSDEAAASAAVFASRYVQDPVPSYELGEKSISKDAAYQIIHDELLLDGSPRLNLASFVTTWMEPECDRLILEGMNKNYADMDEYPVTTELQASYRSPCRGTFYFQYYVQYVVSIKPIDNVVVCTAEPVREHHSAAVQGAGGRRRDGRRCRHCRVLGGDNARRAGIQAALAEPPEGRGEAPRQAQHRHGSQCSGKKSGL